MIHITKRMRHRLVLVLTIPMAALFVNCPKHPGTDPLPLLLLLSSSSSSAAPSSPWRNPASQDMRSVVWGNNQFVAVGANGAVMTSPDGATWTQRTSGVTVTLWGVAYSSGTYVAVGGTRTVLTSSDGVTWNTNSDSSLNTTGELRFVTTDGSGTFVAGGKDTTCSGAACHGIILASSTPGGAWTTRGTGMTYGEFFGGFYGNGKFLVVGGLGLYGHCSATCSTASNFTTLTSSTILGHTGATYMLSGAYGASKYVVGMEFGSMAYTPTPGTEFTIIPNPSSATPNFDTVLFDGSRFIAIDSSRHNALVSTDGINWTASALGSPANRAARFWGSAYNGTLYVFATDLGIMTTTSLW